MRSLKFISAALLVLAPVVAKEQPKKYDTYPSAHQCVDVAIDEKGSTAQVFVFVKAQPEYWFLPYRYDKSGPAPWESTAAAAGDVVFFTKENAKVTVNPINKNFHIDEGNAEPTLLKTMKDDASGLLRQCRKKAKKEELKDKREYRQEEEKLRKEATKSIRQKSFIPDALTR